MLDDALDQHKALTRELLGLATVATDKPLDRAAALITAATVVIEMEVGTAAAGDVLATLVAPTLAQWQAATPRAAT